MTPAPAAPGSRPTSSPTPNGSAPNCGRRSRSARSAAETTRGIRYAFPNHRPPRNGRSSPRCTPRSAITSSSSAPTPRAPRSTRCEEYSATSWTASAARTPRPSTPRPSRRRPSPGGDTVPPALPLSPRQIESIATSTARVNLWHGAIRSGKTFASLLRWLAYVATEAPLGGELVVIGRTRESIGRNVLAPLADPALFGPAAAHVHYTPGSPTATVLGRRVHVIGASDAKAEKVLRGLTCAGALVDELTVIAHGFFVQLL